MELNEIKKSLYKENPKATFSFNSGLHYRYTALLKDGTRIKFKVPISDMGETKFSTDKEDAKLLIRWIKI